MTTKRTPSESTLKSRAMEGGEHAVALEPPVWDALVEYVNRLRRATEGV